MLPLVTSPTSVPESESESESPGTRRKESLKWATAELAKSRKEHGYQHGDARRIARRAAALFNCTKWHWSTVESYVEQGAVGVSPAKFRRPRSFPEPLGNDIIDQIGILRAAKCPVHKELIIAVAQQAIAPP